MRISTALLSTLVAAGSISASMQYALVQQSAEPALPLGDIPLAAPASQPADQTTSEPTASATAAEPSAPTTETATSEPASAAPAAPAADATSPAEPDAPAATQAPQQTVAPAPEQTVAPAPEPVVTTVTSDVIEYKYGVVQISLTATDGTITNVSLLQGDASYGRDAAYAALIDATIAAQGTNYGNYSGATFTTDAFKKAVTNAIGKL